MFVYVCLRVLVCVGVCLRDSSFSSLPWKERGRLGSNDTGSPQHLATAPFVWMSVYKCVRSRRKWPIWMCWSKWTGGDGISVWEVFLPYTKTEIIREQMILDHKKLDCSSLTSVSQIIYILKKNSLQQNENLGKFCYGSHHCSPILYMSVIIEWCLEGATQYHCNFDNQRINAICWKFIYCFFLSWSWGPVVPISSI